MTVDQLNKLMGLLSEASTVFPMHQDLPQWMQEIGDELRKRAAGNSVQELQDVLKLVGDDDTSEGTLKRLRAVSDKVAPANLDASLKVSIAKLVDSRVAAMVNSFPSITSQKLLLHVLPCFDTCLGADSSAPTFSRLRDAAAQVTEAKNIFDELYAKSRSVDEQGGDTNCIDIEKAAGHQDLVDQLLLVYARSNHMVQALTELDTPMVKDFQQRASVNLASVSEVLIRIGSSHATRCKESAAEDLETLRLLKGGTDNGSEWMAGLPEKRLSWAKLFNHAKESIMKAKRVPTMKKLLDKAERERWLQTPHPTCVA